ncbi:MAG: 3-hydroxyacyl-ACP dehydratase FabZ [Caldicoprobacter oshimai]|nr:3-hydroxyacyl-ACP dehydratase FabZ [Caldicoprobacter faecalis]PZN11224.1 MAG: 3-hydroxyacyl-[acyl-carrier-protein] dehydratase FabZ [Caldicoprobacter oshimai]
MKVEEIMECIPHRYPFLLIDRIIEFEPGKRAVGIKNVTINEWFFQGHFPGMPIMPGVLILEALAQLGAVVVLYSEQNRGKIPVFAGVDKLRFRRQVVPGDQLRLEAEISKVKSSMGKGVVRALVDGEVAVEGEVMFALVDKKGD